MNSTKAIFKNGDMSIGDLWELEENHIRTGKVLNFCADIEAFEMLSLGHGRDRDCVRIDNSNIYHVKNGEITEIYAHGLELANNIQVNIMVKDEPNYNAYVTIVSNGIRYAGTLHTWYGNQGCIFAESGSELKNCSFSWTCRNYDAKVYAFGDSYFGHGGDNRWVYYLLSGGYDHCLLDGFAGRASLQALESLKADFKHGIPKYLFWALGMNDNDRGALNENWLYCVKEVLKLCEQHGIIPILATIPNTPTRDNTHKNDFVRKSGHRYVDFAKAVGAEVLGSQWYGNMLFEDKVHPSPSGALALYQQVLCDFPEILLK